MNRNKFNANSGMNGGLNGKYVYNCGFVPTVLNRALNVSAIGDELSDLCSGLQSPTNWNVDHYVFHHNRIYVQDSSLNSNLQ